MPDSWQLKAAHPDLVSLTGWAVEARYPADMPEATNVDASEAIEQARAVWTSICTVLVEHGYPVEKDL